MNPADPIPGASSQGPSSGALLCNEVTFHRCQTEWPTSSSLFSFSLNPSMALSSAADFSKWLSNANLTSDVSLAQVLERLSFKGIGDSADLSGPGETRSKSPETLEESLIRCHFICRCDTQPSPWVHTLL